MGDKLEKFIKENAGSFDDLTPSDKVWSNISRQLPTQNIAAKNIWWKVAAVVFFITSGVLAHQNYYHDGNTASGELAELEDYYFSQIDYKKALVVGKNNSSVIEGVEEDLQKLDAMYMVLKEEWKRKPSQQVLEALSLNLLIRLDLLNRQLESLEKKQTPSDLTI